jgi:hypothetical protein
MLKDIIEKKSIKQKSSSHPELNCQTWTWDQDNPIENNIYIYKSSILNQSNIKG